MLADWWDASLVVSSGKHLQPVFLHARQQLERHPAGLLGSGSFRISTGASCAPAWVFIDWRRRNARRWERESDGSAPAPAPAGRNELAHGRKPWEVWQPRSEAP